MQAPATRAADVPPQRDPELERASERPSPRSPSGLRVDLRPPPPRVLPAIRFRGSRLFQEGVRVAARLSGGLLFQEPAGPAGGGDDRGGVPPTRSLALLLVGAAGGAGELRVDADPHTRHHSAGFWGSASRRFSATPRAQCPRGRSDVASGRKWDSAIHGLAPPSLCKRSEVAVKQHTA